MANAHVDDFQFAGDHGDPIWMKCRQFLRQSFKWGEWTQGAYKNTGLHVVQRTDFGIELDQEEYVRDLQPIM
eukprot:6494959-Lingulodinium_polyedra.AAC.1